ncbi:MAG: hypothetical protein R3C39_09130 [Dehalococcoidia bacterium]
MRDFLLRNRAGLFFYALISFLAIVVNVWFGAAVVAGIAARLYSGHVISIAAGLAVGVTAVELLRLLTR